MMASAARSQYPGTLANGEEFTTPLNQLIRFGVRLFTAQFTVQERSGATLFLRWGAQGSQQAPVSAPLFAPAYGTRESLSKRLVMFRK